MLLHFLFNPIGIIADIEKAYLQISIADCHRDFLRFLWFGDIFKDIPEVINYRFCRVIFRANCLQYLLNSVIRFHASKYKNVDKEFSEKVAKIFYVDDFNSTAKDISEGIEIYKKIKLKFIDASFNVRKWKTNNPDCMFLQASLAKWLSVRLRTKWFWVRVQLQSLITLICKIIL